jgi:hypothetical protein
MNNLGESQENNILANKELKSAFQSIQYIIYHKEEKIKQLEEENMMLKNKIKELETLNYNRELSNYDNLKKPQKETEFNSIREIKYRNIPTTQNQSNTSYGLKYQNEKEDFLSSPGSPFTNLKNTQNEIPIMNELNVRKNFVPVYSNENNNYLYSPNQNIEILKSPVRTTHPTDDSNNSRNDVKLFLNEVREKIPSKEFKEFIKLIKILTDKNNQVPVNRKDIFDKVKILFGMQFRDMYYKFEQLLSVKK